LQCFQFLIEIMFQAISFNDMHKHHQVHVHARNQLQNWSSLQFGDNYVLYNHACIRKANIIMIETKRSKSEFGYFHMTCWKEQITNLKDENQ
jgi:hypothetical protein